MVDQKVAALFVIEDGPYSNLPDVDPWPESRDALTYLGPWPVVAHPPCARWGNYWFGSPSSLKRYELGDDGGCFASALNSVEMFGGVLEHPAGSFAWPTHGIVAPPTRGWCRAGLFRKGWTCQVEQGHYGHPARKPTWLYAVAPDLPDLTWGASDAKARIDLGAKTTEERRRMVRRGEVELLSKRQRALTPEPFRDLLLSIARSCAKVTP